MSDFENLSETIRELRELRGWGQRELARRAGVGHNQISQWENATYVPKLQNLQKLADAFDARPSELLDDAGL